MLAYTRYAVHEGSSVGVEDGFGGCHEVDGVVGCGTGSESSRVCILGVHIVVGRRAQRGVPCVVRIMCCRKVHVDPPLKRLAVAGDRV